MRCTSQFFKAPLRSLIVLFLILAGAAISSGQKEFIVRQRHPASHQLSPETLKLLQHLTEPEKILVNHIRQEEATEFDVHAAEGDRTIRAEFIEELLTGDLNVIPTRRGFRLENAVIHGFLSLRSARVPVEVDFFNCQFDGGVDFASSHFVAPLSLEGSIFKGSSAYLNFNSMSVDGNLELNKVKFDGSPEFFHLAIKSDLRVDESKFNNTERPVRFDQSEIQGTIFIQDSTFRSMLSLADVSTKGLTLQKVTAQKGVSLRYAHIQTVLYLDNISPVGTTALEGLTYGDLGGGDSVGEQLLNRIKELPFSAQSYSQLDDYYRLHGYLEQANTVYIEMKRREIRLEKAYSSSAEVPVWFDPGCGCRVRA